MRGHLSALEQTPQPVFGLREAHLSTKGEGKKEVAHRRPLTPDGQQKPFDPVLCGSGPRERTDVNQLLAADPMRGAGRAAADENRPFGKTPCRSARMRRRCRSESLFQLPVGGNQRATGRFRGRLLAHGRAPPRHPSASELIVNSRVMTGRIVPSGWRSSSENASKTKKDRFMPRVPRRSGRSTASRKNGTDRQAVVDGLGLCRAARGGVIDRRNLGRAQVPADRAGAACMSPTTRSDTRCRGPALDNKGADRPKAMARRKSIR